VKNLPSKVFRVLIDYAHGEILNISDPEYEDFSNLLKQLGYKITLNYSNLLDNQILKEIDVLIIGCPVNHYLLKEEINSIINFVINGGGLLVISEYGGDSIQKTNLNDLTKNFGIYFENTLVKSSQNSGSFSLPIIKTSTNHLLTKNINKIVFGGACSIRIAKDAYCIVSSNSDMWIEIYDDLNNVWIKSDNQNVPLIANTTYGQGKVVAIGDIDLFTNHSIFGLKALDNYKLITNFFSWFANPVSSENTIDWLLNQTSIQKENLFELKEMFKSLEETIEKLNRKVKYLEESNLKINKSLINILNIINPNNIKIENENLIQEEKEIEDLNNSKLNNENNKAVYNSTDFQLNKNENDKYLNSKNKKSCSYQNLFPSS